MYVFQIECFIERFLKQFYAFVDDLFFVLEDFSTNITAV